MPDSATLFLYSTTVSDVGYVRSNNQDSSFAGEHLLAICDGMGGHAGGDTASTIAIRSLAHIEHNDSTSGSKDPAAVKTVAEMMENSVLAAHDAIVGKARRERKLSGMGTTVTAVALVAGYWVLAHIGDSRAYLLRDGHLIRMTKDHSYVQHLIDTGRITPAEAKNHPQRNVVMRVLGDFDIDPRPDVSVHVARPTDRWLLCSDGLCGVLADSTIATTLASVADQNACAQQLVQMALKAGSTDNVTAVVGDATLALDADAFDLPHQTPLIGGAASATLEPLADIVDEPVAAAPRLKDDHDSPASRAAALTQTMSQRIAAEQASKGADGKSEGQRVAQPSAERAETGELQVPDTGEIPVVQKRDGRVSADPNDPDVAKAIVREQRAHEGTARRRRKRGRVAVLIAVLAALAMLCGAVYGTFAWIRTRYYVGEADGYMTIYRGVPTNIFGLQLSREVERTDVSLDSLPQSWQDRLEAGIVVDDLDAAHERANYIDNEIRAITENAQASASPTPTASDSASASESGTPAPADSATPSGGASSAAQTQPNAQSPASPSQGGAQ
ncbi:phosphoprotein phosphatase [Bifidobacterium sp. DSM 109958]|uniref:Phosphoprotein phosphatase n=1 Tax=Bifidobacterium moraviense TaxID=2675323 RepID=A0A7Y0HZI8_9BIFI|nr:protein phosphatase 2C domain-containing protein [Bifidobacterium sp. DSM 109958]NMN00849.1 phosphoprotein phosphatase [Bifidobacterium sp. DSM 109958]